MSYISDSILEVVGGSKHKETKEESTVDNKNQLSNSEVVADEKNNDVQEVSVKE